jgi:hypothetical protein
MVSLTSTIEKQLNRNFVIFHPSDFSPASEVAFGHALKIAMQSKAKLDIMHVETPVGPEKPYWLDFPAVRATLTRWGILPEGVRPSEVAKAGVRIRKILASSTAPVETMLRHFDKFPPDLIVLHPPEGRHRTLVAQSSCRTARTPVRSHDSFCSAQRQRFCIAQRRFACTEKNSYTYRSRSQSPSGA